MQHLFLHLLVLIGIYIVLTVALDLLIGQAGLLSIAQAAFYGVGAYTSALMTIHLGTSFIGSTAAGVITSVLVSVALSLTSLRLYEDYFVIATFAFQMILFSVFNNWVGLTHGPFGIPNIPQPEILGWKIQSPFSFVTLAALLAGLAYLVVGRISASPFGRVLRAIREDEVLTESLGKNTLRFKALAFAVSAALAGLAGSLYAQYVSYIDPTNFTIMESILLISMVIIGGAGSRWGPLIGAVALVTLPEALRFIGLPPTVAANLRQIIYGALLVIMMMVRPRGLVGKYGFGR
jgi:branched-chain amino acid transport system permease protein